jgi:uncharacterized membrane protein
MSILPQTFPMIIQIHLGFVMIATALGPIALLRRHRDRLHRAVGSIWICAMLGVAISSLFISENPMLGPFSVIHILSFITLGGLAYGLRAAWRREFIAHGRAMRALYVQALMIPGVFTFLPGRRMHALMGGGEGLAVFLAAILLGALLAAVIWFHPNIRAALAPDGAGQKIPLFFARPKR